MNIEVGGEFSPARKNLKKALRQATGKPVWTEWHCSERAYGGLHLMRWPR